MSDLSCKIAKSHKKNKFEVKENEMSDKIDIVILAAGKGTRLKMDIPKPLVPIHNKTLVDYVIKSVDGLGEIFIITGHGKDLVESHISEKWNHLGVSYVVQKEQLGTGHAVRTYFDETGDTNRAKYTLVMCADTPLIEKEDIQKLVLEVKKGYQAVVATFFQDNPTGYGRILKAEKGLKIVEEKDANNTEKLVKEVNSGLYIFETAYLKDHIYGIDSNNKAGEFYLTDTFAEGRNVSALDFDVAETFLGVNNLVQLSQAEKFLTKRVMKRLMLEKGVRIIDPEQTYVYTSNVGSLTSIFPNSHIDEETTIGKNVIIEHGCTIIRSDIKDNCVIKANSYLTDSVVGESSKIGPMAQLRPGSKIGDNCKLGNFVEVKKSQISSGSSVSHLSYVGDAEIGKNVNIGCGFITCNYDGANKHKTIIGDESFIGSDCQMIAPITLGKGVYIGSGSTINKDIPDDSFAVARQRQVTKDGQAHRFIKKKK